MLIPRLFEQFFDTCCMSDKTTIMLILFGTLVWLMTVNIERSEYDQQRNIE